MSEKLPIGWFDLVADLRLDLMRDFPSANVVEMTADRGWLHVRIDVHRLDPAARLRAGRLVQGYVTQSLTTCMRCSSIRGLDRGERKEITCSKCEEDACDA